MLTKGIEPNYFDEDENPYPPTSSGSEDPEILDHLEKEFKKIYGNADK